MSAYVSYLLQSLDIECFAVLKRIYRGLIMEEMCLGINSIDKDDFIQLYSIAREAVFKAQIIQNSFKDTGLVSLDANYILDKLNIQLESFPLSQPPEP